MVWYGWLGIVGFIIVALFFIYYASIQLVQGNYDSEVRIVFYFLSLSWVISGIIIIYARSIDAISEAGNFEGEMGNLLHKVFELVLDFSTDFKILFALICVIILPQIINYVICGCFGCAATPILLKKSFSFFMWSVVKSFSVISGVFITIAIFYIFSSNSLKLEDISRFFLMSVVLALLSIYYLWMYCESEKLSKKIESYCASHPQNKIVIMHKWFTRNIKKTIE